RDTLAGLGANRGLLLPGRPASVPRGDVEPGGPGDRAEPRVGERTPVLAGLVREEPVVERPVAILRGRTPGARPGLDRFVVRETGALPLERGVAMHDPERPVGDVVTDERRLHGLGEAATDRTLEV